MSKYNPTAVTIEELRAFGIEPTKSDAMAPATIKYTFFSTTENDSLLSRLRRAIAKLNTTPRGGAQNHSPTGWSCCFWIFNRKPMTS